MAKGRPNPARNRVGKLQNDFSRLLAYEKIRWKRVTGVGVNRVDEPQLGLTVFIRSARGIASKGC